MEGMSAWGEVEADGICGEGNGEEQITEKGVVNSSQLPEILVGMTRFELATP